MKLLDLQLDEAFAVRDYDGMVALVAQHLGLRLPGERASIDTSSPGNWRWGRVIIYQDHFRYIYRRGGSSNKAPTISTMDCGIVSELPL